MRVCVIDASDDTLYICEANELCYDKEENIVQISLISADDYYLTSEPNAIAYNEYCEFVNLLLRDGYVDMCNTLKHAKFQIEYCD